MPAFPHMRCLRPVPVARVGGKVGWAKLTYAPYGGGSSVCSFESVYPGMGAGNPYACTPRQLSTSQACTADGLTAIRFLAAPVPVLESPRLNARTLATLPKCTPVAVDMSSARGSDVAVPDRRCWVKVAYGKQSGWIFLSKGTNVQDPCGDTDAGTEGAMSKLLKWPLCSLGPQYFCGDRDGSSHWGRGHFTKDILATKLMHDQDSCCSQCGITKGCKAYSYELEGKLCKLTNNTWQVPNPATASIGGGVNIGVSNTWLVAYVARGTPDLPIWRFVEGSTGPDGEWVDGYYERHPTLKVKPCEKVTVQNDWGTEGIELKGGKGSCFVKVRYQGTQQGLLLKAVGGNAAHPCWAPVKTYLTLTNPCGSA